MKTVKLTKKDKIVKRKLIKRLNNIEKIEQEKRELTNIINDIHRLKNRLNKLEVTNKYMQQNIVQSRHHIHLAFMVLDIKFTQEYA